jgi:BirA family biotin operon repressor/biotin-[acetyl-CoA-carboxylase] ligase
MNESLDRDRISAGEAARLRPRIIVFRETESTNDVVMRAAEGGEPEGLVAFAERQTKGRGQFGRKWSSADGVGLWFSVLLRPRWPASKLPEMTPLVAVAVARALAMASGLPIRIKPPNDIFCQGRKLAGILSEARTGNEVFVIVGIGINVNHAVDDFPLELRTSATSLAIEAGVGCDREQVASAVLAAIDELYDADDPPGAAVHEEYALLSRRPICDSFPT